MSHPKDSWETELPVEATDCSFCDLNKKPIFVLTPKLFGVAQKLCIDIQREWQILLIGEETPTGILCYDYYTPSQETGLATVKNTDDISLEFVTKKKIVATMHSHNEIGVSFSSTDNECTNNSFIKHHIVTNNKGDFMAISRIILPCGLVKFAKASVTMKMPEVKLVKGIERIKERIYKAFDTTLDKAFKVEGSDITYHAGSSEGITWKKRGNKRNHAFKFDQREGGFYG